MAPAPTAAPTTVAERLTAAQARLAAAEGSRKWWRLSIKLRAKADQQVPLPFSSVTIGTKATQLAPSRPFTFQEFTNPLVADERNPNRFQLGKRRGSWTQATAQEIDALKARIDDYVVRWVARKAETRRDGEVVLAYAADLLDTTIESNMAGLNPTTDEPVGQYLVIEGPYDAVID